MDFFNLRSPTSPTNKTQTYGRRISAEFAERVKSPTKPVIGPTRRDVIQRTQLFLREPEEGSGGCLPVQEELSAVSGGDRSRDIIVSGEIGHVILLLAFYWTITYGTCTWVKCFVAEFHFEYHD